MPTSRHRRSRLASFKPASLTVAVGLALAASDALALGSDTVFISGSTGLKYDTNVFLVSNELTPQQVQGFTGSTEKSDTIYWVGAGISADVPYSRQRFQANLNVTNYDYRRFSFLNYTGGSGQAQWLWQAGDDWNGDVGAQLSRSLQSLYYTNQRNIIDRENYYFDPKYRIAPNWELQGGVSYGTTRNDLASFDVNDLNETSGYLGSRYITPSGNSVGLRLSTSKVEFPNIIFVSGSSFDNAYRENRLSTFFDWTFSGASKVDGSWGYAVRTHDHLPQRDFSSWIGSAGWTWTPTAKTSVRTQLSRNVGGLEDIAVTYVRTYTFSIVSTYQVSSKVAVNGTLQYQDYRFFGNTGFGFSTTSNRHDTLPYAGLGLTYQAMRTLEFGFNYNGSHRSSNVPFGDFNDQTVSLSAVLRF